MAWKNLKQRSLADELVTEHDALTELDDVNALMDWQAIEDILRDIHAKRRGNAAWPPLFMLAPRRFVWISHYLIPRQQDWQSCKSS